MTRPHLIMSFALFALAAIPLMAQTDPELEQGIKPYGAFHGGDIDAVSMTNGNLTLKIPVFSYPQRGNVTLAYSLVYNAKSYKPITTCDGAGDCTTNIILRSMFPGVHLVQDDALGISATYVSWKTCTGNVCDTYDELFNSITDSEGATHPLGQTGTNTYESIDATGLMYNSSQNVIVDQAGTRHVMGGTCPVVEDANGNELCLDGSGNWLDTVGRSVLKPGAAPPQLGSGNMNQCVGPLPTSSAVTYQMPVFGGGTGPYTLCYAQISVYSSYNFNEGTWLSSTYQVLQSVVLPNNQSWVFAYSNDGFANLTEVTLPTGGTISYTWTAPSDPCSTLPTTFQSWVSSRTVNANDGNGSHTWNYTWNMNTSPNATNTVTDPLGNDTVFSITNLGYGWGQACDLFPATVTHYAGSQSAGQVLESESTTYSSNIANFPLSSITNAINVVPVAKTTMVGNGVTKESTYSYDGGFNFTYEGEWGGTVNGTGIYGKALSQSDYDYGPGQAGSLLRTRNTSYLALQNSSYLANNLLLLPSSVTVLDGSGSTVEQTTYGYDETSLNSSGVSTQHDSNPPGGSARGNVTSVHRWLSGESVSTSNCPVSVNNGLVTSTTDYFDTGMTYQSADPCGHTTTYGYSSSYAGAYPTQVMNALSQTSTAGYDFNTGLKTSSTDPNNQTTTYSYDSMLRLTSVVTPDIFPNTSTHGETGYCYNDTASECGTYPVNSVVATKVLSSILSAKSEFDVDCLGRLVETKLLTDPDGESFTRDSYDADGRKYQEWNPTRCDPMTHSSCSGETTWGITTHLYDALGRETKLIPPDGTVNTDNVTTSYNGNTVTVTDEAGVSRTTTTDGLGRMTQVTENNMGWTTAYVYDALGNLTCAEQHGGVSGTGCASSPSNDSSSPWRVRRFTYDSLSQLLTSKNPETGQIAYQYDSDGTLITKTDARGIMITYSADALHRLTGKSYSDSEASISYFYDATGSNNYGVGRRTGMSDASGSTTWTYDQMGRIWTEQRIISNVNKSVSTTYYLDGSPYQITYPSGNVVTYSLSAVARTIAASDAAHSYASALTYAPHGVLAAGTLGYVSGGFGGITEANQYDSRLQPTLISASTTGQTLLSLGYNFGLGVNDNGNLYHITNSKDTSRNLTATYDGANRIQLAHGDAVSPATPGSGTVTISGLEGTHCVIGDSQILGSQAQSAVLSPQIVTCRGTLVYDFGTVSVTVGPTMETVTYEEGSTASTVAAALAMAFTADPSSVVSVSLSGTKLTFTAKTTGSDTNYALSAATTSEEPEYFPNGSFIGTPSGATLTGGADSGPAPGQLDETYGIDAWGDMNASGTISFNEPFGVNNRVNVFTYDAAGNLLSDGSNSYCPGGMAYTYNAESQMSCGAGITYTYDGDGGRVEKSSGVLYWGGEEGAALAESDLSGNITSEYIFVNGKRIARKDAGGSVYYYLSDHLGSSNVVTNAAGTIENESDFYPYGVEHVVTENLSNHYKFTGKERDSESGNDYFGARYYASSMGRFMSPDWTETPDPIPYADQKDPQTLNLYTYGLNNPLLSTDPDGHIPVTFCSKDKATTTQDAQGNIHVTVTAGHCTTLDDGRITPGDDGLGLIAGWGLGKVISPIIGAGVGWVADLFESDAINITEEGMEHVLERHAADGVNSAGKSLFKGSEGEIKSLIKKAASTAPTKQANGNLARVVNAGRTIGVDRATGAPTSTYTVITKASGDLVTAFPGRP